MSVGFMTDPPLTKVEPFSDSGSTSVIFKKGEKKHWAKATSAGESENM